MRKGDRLAQILDRLAEATGVPWLTRRLKSGRVYHFRFLPAVLLVISVVGLVAEAKGSPFGYSVIAWSWALTVIVHLFSPFRKIGTFIEPEEKQRLRHASLLGMSVAWAAAVMGCLVFGLEGVFTDLGWGAIWRPSKPFDWTSCAFLLLTVQVCAALLAEAWRPDASQQRGD